MDMTFHFNACQTAVDDVTEHRVGGCDKAKRAQCDTTLVVRVASMASRADDW
jgi:hypothetical protein